MTENEKVIKGLEHCYKRDKACIYCPYHGECCTSRLARDAFILLKGYESRVMTLDELYDAEYVFYEDDKIGVLCVLPCGNDEDEWYFTSAQCIIIERRRDNYKKSWRCWTSRPTDEQRKAVKWE